VFDGLGTDHPSLFGKAVISTDTRSLTAEDLEFFGPPVRVLSVAGGPLSPQSRLVWFEATAEGAIQLFTGPDTLKVRRLGSDPTATIVVAAPVGERERWVTHDLADGSAERIAWSRANSALSATPRRRRR
jgi:hypothetical protein